MARSWASRLAATLVASHFFVSSIVAQSTTLAVDSAIASPTASLASPSESAISSGPKNYLVKVGADGFKYTPQSLSNVSVGDVVTFEFYPRDHSVARAEFGSACIPYEYTGKNKQGFFSTTQWIDSVDKLTHWNLTINSTEPIFFYCTAPDSCRVKGMVGVINPNSTHTLDLQVAAARSADFMVAPGQPIPKEASTSLVNAPTASVSVSPTHSAQPSNNGGSSGISGGAIAGIVVGAVAFLIICAALFFYVGRFKSLKEVIKNQDAAAKNGAMSEADRPGTGYQYGHGHNLSFVGQNPFSPTPSHSEFGTATSPPMYRQHGLTEQYPNNWASPGYQNGHMSMMSGFSGVSGTTHQQMDEIKAVPVQQHPVELGSSSPNGQELSAELEASGPKK